MSTITFDSLKLVLELKRAGIQQEHAEAIVEAIVAAQDNLVTRDYLDIALSPLKTDLAVLKWIMGIILAGVLSLIIKAFFN